MLRSARDENYGFFLKTHTVFSVTVVRVKTRIRQKLAFMYIVMNIGFNKDVGC